jgi:hypothetical protein
MLAPIEFHCLTTQGGRNYAEDFRCSAVCNCHVCWIGSRDPCAQTHDGGLRRGPAGDCEMPLRYRSRCRPNNLREGAMVPLHGTRLLEVRAASLGRQDSGGLILSHLPSAPVASRYTPQSAAPWRGLTYFVPFGGCTAGPDLLPGWPGTLLRSGLA